MQSTLFHLNPTSQNSPYHFLELIPYHTGKTCKQYAEAKDAKKHCRFCDAALPLAHPAYTPPNPDTIPVPPPPPPPHQANDVGVLVDPLAESIEISGCDYPNDNGLFVLDGRRNGQPCYSRRPGPGALYFDGMQISFVEYLLG
jgi:hypothetical protein